MSFFSRLLEKIEPITSGQYDRVNANKVTRKRSASVKEASSQQPFPQSSRRTDRSAEDSRKDVKATEDTEGTHGPPGEKNSSAFKIARNAVTAIFLCLALIRIALYVYPRFTVPSPSDGPSTDAGTQYAKPLSFIHNPSDEQVTEYVLAFDNSGSMSDSVEKRNIALDAIIRGLPKDRTHATAFAFSNKSQGEPLQDILPMSEDEFRKTIEDVVQDSSDAKGGTDLGEMMSLAIGRFSEQGQDPSKRHVLFIVTDGWSDGATDAIAKARDEKFFSMCETYRDNVDIYIIYVSEDRDILQRLSSELNTQPVELLEDTGGAQLTTWEKNDDGTRKESAKILAIPDVDELETALLLLQYANMDADRVFFRTAEKDRTISFPIPHLCTQELTIALSGNVPVQETLHELKWEGDSGTDLLQTAVIGDNPSIVTIRRKDGLQPGLYTMKIKTDRQLSAIFSYQNNYKVRFGLENVNSPVRPPADYEAALHMQLLRPDGTPLTEDASVVLSMRVEHMKEDNTSNAGHDVNNGEQLSFANLELEEGDKLRFYPVVISSGVKEETDGFWDIQLTGPLVPEELPEPGFPDQKMILKLQSFLNPLLYIFAVAFLLLWIYGYLNDIAAKEAQLQKEILPTKHFICAGICWHLQGNGKKYYLGSLGPTDDKGGSRHGCDLAAEFMWCLEKSRLVKRRNPLKFCRWRYSSERHCTELVLRTDRWTIAEDKEHNLLHHQINEPFGRKVEFFGVDENHQSGTVKIKTPVLEGEFQLNYYYKYKN